MAARSMLLGALALACVAAFVQISSASCIRKSQSPSSCVSFAPESYFSRCSCVNSEPVRPKEFDVYSGIHSNPNARCKAHYYNLEEPPQKEEEPCVALGYGLQVPHEVSEPVKCSAHSYKVETVKPVEEKPRNAYGYLVTEPHIPDPAPKCIAVGYQVETPADPAPEKSSAYGYAVAIPRHPKAPCTAKSYNYQVEVPPPPPQEDRYAYGIAVQAFPKPPPCAPCVDDYEFPDVPPPPPPQPCVPCEDDYVFPEPEVSVAVRDQSSYSPSACSCKDDGYASEEQDNKSEEDDDCEQRYGRKVQRSCAVSDDDSSSSAEDDSTYPWGYSRVSEGVRSRVGYQGVSGLWSGSSTEDSVGDNEYGDDGREGDSGEYAVSSQQADDYLTDQRDDSDDTTSYGPYSTYSSKVSSYDDDSDASKETDYAYASRDNDDAGSYRDEYSSGESQDSSYGDSGSYESRVGETDYESRTVQSSLAPLPVEESDDFGVDSGSYGFREGNFNTPVQFSVVKSDEFGADEQENANDYADMTTYSDNDLSSNEDDRGSYEQEGYSSSSNRDSFGKVQYKSGFTENNEEQENSVLNSYDYSMPKYVTTQSRRGYKNRNFHDGKSASMIYSSSKPFTKSYSPFSLSNAKYDYSMNFNQDEGNSYSLTEPTSHYYSEKSEEGLGNEGQVSISYDNIVGKPAKYSSASYGSSEDDLNPDDMYLNSYTRKSSHTPVACASCSALRRKYDGSLSKYNTERNSYDEGNAYSSSRYQTRTHSEPWPGKSVFKYNPFPFATQHPQQEYHQVVGHKFYREIQTDDITGTLSADDDTFQTPGSSGISLEIDGIKSSNDAMVDGVDDEVSTFNGLAQDGDLIEVEGSDDGSNHVLKKVGVQPEEPDVADDDAITEGNTLSKGDDKEVVSEGVNDQVPENENEPETEVTASSSVDVEGNSDDDEENGDDDEENTDDDEENADEDEENADDDEENADDDEENADDDDEDANDDEENADDDEENADDDEENSDDDEEGDADEFVEEPVNAKEIVGDHIITSTESVISSKDRVSTERDVIVGGRQYQTEPEESQDDSDKAFVRQGAGNSDDAVEKEESGILKKYGKNSERVVFVEEGNRKEAEVIVEGKPEVVYEKEIIVKESDGRGGVKYVSKEVTEKVRPAVAVEVTVSEPRRRKKVSRKSKKTYPSEYKPRGSYAVKKVKSSSSEGNPREEIVTKLSKPSDGDVTVSVTEYVSSVERKDRGYKKVDEVPETRTTRLEKVLREDPEEVVVRKSNTRGGSEKHTTVVKVHKGSSVEVIVPGSDLKEEVIVQNELRKAGEKVYPVSYDASSSDPGTEKTVIIAEKTSTDDIPLGYTKGDKLHSKKYGGATVREYVVKKYEPDDSKTYVEVTGDPDTKYGSESENVDLESNSTPIYVEETTSNDPETYTSSHEGRVTTSDERLREKKTSGKVLTVTKSYVAESSAPEEVVVTRNEYSPDSPEVGISSVANEDNYVGSVKKSFKSGSVDYSSSTRHHVDARRKYTAGGDVTVSTNTESYESPDTYSTSSTESISSGDAGYLGSIKKSYDSVPADLSPSARNSFDVRHKYSTVGDVTVSGDYQPYSSEDTSSMSGVESRFSQGGSYVDSVKNSYDSESDEYSPPIPSSVNVKHKYLTRGETTVSADSQPDNSAGFYEKSKFGSISPSRPKVLQEQYEEIYSPKKYSSSVGAIPYHSSVEQVHYDGYNPLRSGFVRVPQTSRYWQSSSESRSAAMNSHKSAYHAVNVRGGSAGYYGGDDDDGTAGFYQSYSSGVPEDHAYGDYYSHPGSQVIRYSRESIPESYETSGGASNVVFGGKGSLEGLGERRVKSVVIREAPNYPERSHGSH